MHLSTAVMRSESRYLQGYCVCKPWTHLAAIADVAGMMQDWPRPRVTRAISSAGNCIDWGAPRTNEVSPVTHDQRKMLTCITGVPPILSATIPRGICKTTSMTSQMTNAYMSHVEALHLLDK